LARAHRRPGDATVAVEPGRRRALLAGRHLQPDLAEDADEQLVHVVVDADRDLDELAPVRARQALTVCEQICIYWFLPLFIMRA